MGSKDFVPGKDEEFRDWAANIMVQLADKAVDWGIPAGKVTALGAVHSAWTNAWTAYLEPNHGKVDTFNKKQARKALEAALRAFIKSYLRYNETVSDEDKEILQIPIPDVIRTPGTAPTSTPEAEVKVAIRQVAFHFKDEGAEKRGKPAGVRCLELRYMFLPTRPANVDVFTKTETATVSPLVLTCAEEDRGKTLWYCMRWEGVTPKLKGPWSEIFSVIVP